MSVVNVRNKEGAYMNSIDVQELFAELRDLMDEAEIDLEKFTVKGNKSAGTRLRKCMQNVKSVAQQIRVKVVEMKKK